MCSLVWLKYKFQPCALRSFPERMKGSSLAKLWGVEDVSILNDRWPWHWAAGHLSYVLAARKFRTVKLEDGKREGTKQPVCIDSGQSRCLTQFSLFWSMLVPSCIQVVFHINVTHKGFWPWIYLNCIKWPKFLSTQLFCGCDILYVENYSLLIFF